MHAVLAIDLPRNSRQFTRQNSQMGFREQA
jgi:hypothetical protein